MNRENNNHGIDYYGTFFYKLRNGNLPFEYDAENQIDKLHKAIKSNNGSMICGLISAIAANYLSVRIDTNNIFYFVLILIGLFIILKGVLFFLDWIARKFHKKFDAIYTSETDEEKIQDFFFKKILVQTTYVFSVTNRIGKITNSEKSKLRRIYSMQGIYGIKKISVELGLIFKNVSAKKKKSYISVIGRENILYVLDVLDDCIKEIQENGIEVLTDDKERLENLKKTINL